MVMKIVIFIFCILFLAACTPQQGGENFKYEGERVNLMEIRSSVFEQGKPIPSKYTCDDQNISPPLEFINVPEGAKSLVLIMDDPDVPKSVREDGMWDHWVVFNIPLNTKEVPEGAGPEGVLGLNTGGKLGYGGPCPPDREHRYFFKLYALDVLLDLPEGASKADVEKVMESHILEKAELIGTYNRQ